MTSDTNIEINGQHPQERDSIRQWEIRFNREFI